MRTILPRCVALLLTCSFYTAFLSPGKEGGIYSQQSFIWGCPKPMSKPKPKPKYTILTEKLTLP